MQRRLTDLIDWLGW